MRYKTEISKAEDIIEKISSKLKKSESTTSEIINKKKSPSKFYRHLSSVILDYILTQLSPADIAEYHNLRGKGII